MSHCAQCEKGYCEASLAQLLKVHGGLTYSGKCQEDEDGHGICHRPAAGEESEIWWIGFDTAHAWDYTPGMAAHLAGVLSRSMRGPSDYEIYRTLDYVQSEVRKLALQLDDRDWKERLESMDCTEKESE